MMILFKSSHVRKFISCRALWEYVRKPEFGLSSLASICFFVCAQIVLFIGSLHEDAYILFQYVKNLSAGFGISFDRLSGPAEGATDFLWMGLLSGLHGLGIDIAVAASALNAAGLGVMLLVLFSLSGGVNRVSVIAASILTLSGGFAAALGGFSTLAFGGLFALYSVSLIRMDYRLIAAFSVILSLFRPDGLVLTLGGGLALLLNSSAEERVKVFRCYVPLLLVGLCYWTWRYWYFGLMLPLPLLVKSKTDNLLEGWQDNISVLRFSVLSLIPFAIALRHKSATLIRDGSLVMLGPLFLLLMLGFAHQSQNVAGRFQFPIVIGLAILLVLAGRREARVPLIAFFPALLMPLSGTLTIIDEFSYLTNADYINSFPQILKWGGYSIERLAMTESGRFPYWYDAPRMLDLVGLNSPAVVTRGQQKALEQFAPQVLFVHHDDRYDVNNLDQSKDYISLPATEVSLRANNSKNPVATAPAVALLFAQKNNFSAVFVKYGKQDASFAHVYFLSPDSNKTRFLDFLDASHSRTISYYESARSSKHAPEGYCDQVPLPPPFMQRRGA